MEKFESIVRSHFATLLVLAGLGMVTVKSPEGRSVGQEARVARFTEHLIWSGYTYNYGICAADIDGDGDPDLTSSDAGGNNALYWFENDGRGNFRRHFITRNAPYRLERHRVADINRDSRPDVVIVENFFGDVKWYENPGDFREGVLWKRHYISQGGLLGAYDVDIADINLDGFPDVAASSWRLGNNFTWFANPGASGQEPWAAQLIDTLPEDTRTVRAADFDGDGRPDLLGTSAAARIVLWYQNTGQSGRDRWKRHVIDLTMGVQPVHGEPFDIDRDGDSDVVMALGGWGQNPGGGVLWYENLGMEKDRLQWRKHTISQELPRGFEVVAGDLDGDADVDVAATGYGSGILAWFENPGDARGRWTRHLLKEGWSNANQVVIDDFNGDGRADIAAIAERGSLELRWWRNEGSFAVVPPAALDVSNQLQLFLDEWLIESLDNVRQVLHSPQPREVVIEADRPYEDGLMYDPVVIKEGARYRMWYRTNYYSLPPYTGYAESADGIHWTKPDLGLIEYEGSRENNLVWPIPGGRGRSLSIFKDENPAALPEERYKAIGSEPTVGGEKRAGIYALVSPDGLRWRLRQPGPMIMAPREDPQFDSHNIALWDSARQQYVVYARGWYREGAPPLEGKQVGEELNRILVEIPSGEVRRFTRIRDIRRYTSPDFRTWTGPEYIDLGATPLEHLYKNAATPYYRRPDLILMFPKRLVPDRKFHPDYPKPYLENFPKNWSFSGLSDVVFMFSRDGFHFDRRFMEAFLRPGPDPKNWAPRAIEIGPTLVPTGSGEMSLYYMEHYYLPDVRIRRGVLREDGFVSLRAPYQGGSVLTKPLRFSGAELRINYSTSAAGSIRVEIQSASGKALSGYSLEDCPQIFGDEINRLVTWKAGSGLAHLAGQAIRLKFEIKDGDLFSLRFE